MPDARAAPRRRARAPGDRRDGAPGRAARAGARAAGHRGGGRLDGADRAPTSPPSPRPSALPVAASFRCQDYVDNALARLRGPRRAGDGPGAGRAHPRGRRAAGHRRAPGRDPDRRLHARAPRRADPAPGPRASRPRRDRRRVPDRAGDRGRPRGLRGRRPRARAGGRRARAPGCSRPRAASTSATSREARELPGPAADVRGDGDAARAPARRGDPHQRRRQLQRVGAPLLRVPPLPDAAGPAQRLDGLRRPGRGRRQGRAPRPPGRVPGRRRRLPDDRPGARDRGPGGAAPSSCSWSTTRCTARSACTRSATTPAASSAPTCATPTSSPTRAPSARTARWSSAPRTSPPPSTRRCECGRPAVIELRVDPQAITPRQTLDEIRAAAS